MRDAILETERRRKIQEEHNKKHGITPKTIKKKIHSIAPQKIADNEKIKKVKSNEIPRLIEELENQMDIASMNMEFERAAEIRDEIEFLRQKIEK